MNRIGLIIAREFNQRVRKRSFILTTLLVPLLMLGVVFAPLWLSRMQHEEQKEIVVSDLSGKIAPALTNDARVTFRTVTYSPEQWRDSLREGYAYLWIGPDIMSTPSDLRLYAEQPVTFDLEQEIGDRIRRILETEKLKAYQIENLPQILDEIQTDVSMQVYRLDESGKQTASSGALSMGTSYLFGLLIYMFVFMYGAMVMQGVIEEKSSKVLEIIVSSVRPFELMLGKILGIAAVALTQVLMWIVLIVLLSVLLLPLLSGGAVAQIAAGGAMTSGLGDLDPQAITLLSRVTDPWFLFELFGSFLLYFIGGYLLYAALFAAIGSAVDNAQDTQQLQVPIMVPMIFALVALTFVMREPSSPLSVWLSMIPFTSPIIMMARIPYGVPAWELALSLGLLYATFLGAVYLAGKIYRVGIFMYGKRPGFREIYKWLSYRS